MKDVYYLLTNGQLERAGKLYSEYLFSCGLDDFLSHETIKDSDDELSFYEQCGYICRYFNPSIHIQHIIDDKAYIKLGIKMGLSH